MQTVAGQSSNADQKLADLKSHADTLIKHVQGLRAESGIAGDQQVALYVMATPLVRGILKQHEDFVKSATNSIDIVQVDDDAGQPMPETIPHKEIYLGEEAVVIGVSDAD
jgi:hypothetical protein